MSRDAFSAWALVEIMGHQRIAGFVSTEEIAGHGMIRVDVPQTPAGAGYTRYFGPSAIYAITPCTEELACAAAAQIEHWTDPVPYELPAPAAAAAGVGIADLDF